MRAVLVLHPSHQATHPKPFALVGVMPVKQKRQDPYRG